MRKELDKIQKVSEKRVQSGNKVALVRRKHKPNDSLSREQLKDLIFEYVWDAKTSREIREKYNITENVFNQSVRRFQEEMNNYVETEKLIEEQMMDSKTVSARYTKYPRKVINPNIINEKFLSKLSGDEEPILTEEEQTYAWIYSCTNNNTKALKDSKLDAGLKKRHDGHETSSYKNSVKLRGYYLRSKENVRQYIISLRERKLEDLKIDKGYVQSQLVSEIEFLNEEADPTKRNTKLRALELLGKTLPGCFSETVKVEEVKPDAALDALLDMAKADIKQLPKNHKKKIDTSYELIES